MHYFSSRLLTGQLCTAWLFTAGAANRRSLIQKLGRYPGGHKNRLSETSLRCKSRSRVHISACSTVHTQLSRQQLAVDSPLSSEMCCSCLKAAQPHYSRAG